MKNTPNNKILLLILLIFCTLVLKSQSVDKNSGLYDLRISGIYTIMGTRAELNQIKIPHGLGITCTYKFNKRLFAEGGFAYKTEGQNEMGGTIRSGSNFYSGKVYHKYTYSYIDIPLQLNYNVISLSSINLYLTTGLKGTVFIYNDYWNPFYDGLNYNESDKKFRPFFYFGLMESCNITKNIGVFASQNYGRYPKFNNSSYKFTLYPYGASLQSFEFKIGATYRFKSSSTH